VSLTISIDAMGGDYGPEVTIPAALDCLKKQSRLKTDFSGR
jgi:glycerol-3-phosphate acyltransferase PlsX